MADVEVSLELYAAVTAALGEGYTLSEVLEHEGLSLDAWEHAEERWATRLQESAETDLALLDELDRALAGQRKRFSRQIEPLDADIEGFITFQRHLVGAPSPTVFLAAQGLVLGDWIRLQESWAERFATDSGMRARASRLLNVPELPPIPAVLAARREMPPPLREPAAAPAIVASAEPVGEDVEEVIEWGLAVLRGEAPTRSLAEASKSSSAPPISPVQAQVDLRAIDSPAAAPYGAEAFPEGLQAWLESAALATEGRDDIAAITLPPSLANPNWRAAASRPMPFTQASPSADSFSPTVERPADIDSDIEGTLPSLPMKDTEPLPFSGLRAPAHKHADDDLAGQTLPLESRMLVPPLPFREMPNVRFAGQQAALDEPDGSNPSESGDATSTMTLSPERFLPKPALPFEHAAKVDDDGPPLRDVDPSTRQTRAAGEIRDPTATMFLAPGAGLANPVMPFLTEESAQPGDEDIDDDASKTIFFVPRSPARHGHVMGNERDGSDAPAQLPSASSAEQDLRPFVPELSLEAHASLCAKLAVSPGEAELIFSEFGLSSPDVRTRVDETWKERLRGDRVLYEQWKESYRVFHARWSDLKA